MDEINVIIEADVNPTESEEKVEKAIEKIFGKIPTQIQSIYKERVGVSTRDELLSDKTDFSPSKTKEKGPHAHVASIYRGVKITAQTNSTEPLTSFANLLRRERIRAAARKILHEGLKGNTITFHLNKQVAYAGHISFSEATAESPLGPIKVTIKCQNPRKLIEQLTRF